MQQPDWLCIAEWIEDICRDMIHHPLQQHHMVQLAHSLSMRHFQETCASVPKSDYQLSVLACLHVVSCYATHRPVDLVTLQTICCHCYEPERIVGAVYAFLRWMSPTLDADPVHYVENLTRDWDTVCDRVCQKGRSMVRKRIVHDGLPAYHAVIEVFVHTVLAQTESSHIARLLAVDVQETQIDLYYEYVEHPVALLQNGDHQQKRKWVLGLLRGVGCLHALGIAHRDLKPDNLHMDADGECQILDVGSAGFGSVRHTNPLCTITHRSPEMLQAEVDQEDYEYDGRTLDMWSLGVVIAQLYGHWRPFGHISIDTTAAQMLQRIQQRTVSTIQTLERVLPAAQVDLVRRCLHHNPHERPQIIELLETFG